MTSLAAVLEWKVGAVADTRNDQIVAWRHETLPEPDAATIATWTAEYEAAQAARAYRDQRAAAYAGFVPPFEGLGEEPGVTVTLGDVLDDVIAQVEVNRAAAGASQTANFALLLSRRASIKAAFPKPE